MNSKFVTFTEVFTTQLIKNYPNVAQRLKNILEELRRYHGKLRHYLAFLLSLFKRDDEFISGKDLTIEKYAADKTSSSKLSLWQGNIACLELDAIVNVTEPSMTKGGEVFQQIHENAGPDLLEECKVVGGCQQGDARLTGGYYLPAKYVIHTVAPQEDRVSYEAVEMCYKSCFDIFTRENLRTIAFPSICSGINGFSEEEAALLALRTTRKYLETRPKYISRVIFCLNPNEMAVYECLAQLFFPPHSESTY